jgi:hypothetical protein
MMAAQALTRPNPTLRDEISGFIADHIRVQANIHHSLQQLKQVVADSTLLTAPPPHLGQRALFVLHRLALVRMCILQVDCEEQGAQAAGVSPSEVERRVTADVAALPEAPLLAAELANIFAAAPFNGRHDGRAQYDQAYLDVVRDQLLALTKLELTALRYVHD